MITAEQVREAMQKQELTQNRLAGMAKVSGSVISQWLSGKAMPSEVTKARVALALGLADAGELDDDQVSAALAPEADELHATDEDAAAAEIMDALGMTEEEDDDEEDDDEEDAEALVVRKAAPEPAPAPTPNAARAEAYPAELVWELTRLPGVRLNADSVTILLPKGGALERYVHNLDALDTMLEAGDIDADAHLIAAASLLGMYKRKEAEA